jgi:hypothetical protein
LSKRQRLATQSAGARIARRRPSRSNSTTIDWLERVRSAQALGSNVVDVEMRGMND